MSIGLETAKTITDGVRAAGKEYGLKPLTVVVLDAGGHVISVEREDHRRPAVEEPVDRVALGGVLGLLAERADGKLVRGAADQRDVDVDVAQFGDVVAAGGEVLDVDVPERVQEPSPVTVPIAGDGRNLHNLAPRFPGQNLSPARISDIAASR